MTATGSHASPGADLVTPDYGGGSIVNLAASVLAAFGVEPPAAPLHPHLLAAESLTGGAGVVLLVIDALGRHQLQAALAAGCTPRLAELIGAAPGGLQSLTSVFPSTTTAALNSLATACPPAVHGVLGHMLWIEEFGTVVNMLTLHPLGADTPVDEDALRRVPTVYEHLSRSGIPSTLVTAAAYQGTPFTNMIQAGAAFAGYEGLSQIPYQLELALIAAGGDQGLYAIYWPLIDTLSHAHGPDRPGAASPACRLEMEFVDLMVGKVARLCRRYGCSLVLVADHGQTRLDPRRAIAVDGPLAAALRGPPGGGRRAPYLSCRDPLDLLADPVLRAATSVLVSADEAVAADWFGGPCHGVRRRLGDVVAVGASGVQFLYDYGRGTHAHVGSHAGLTADEMIVPLVVVPAP